MSIATLNALKGYAAAGLGPEKRVGGASAPAQGAAAPETFVAARALAAEIAGAEKAATAFVTTGADPHSVIEAIASAELAVETAVTIRDKVVEAYQELLRMPV